MSDQDEHPTPEGSEPNPRPQLAPAGWSGGTQHNKRSAPFEYTVTLDSAEMELVVSVLWTAATEAAHEASGLQTGHGLDGPLLEANAREWRLLTLRDRLMEHVQSERKATK